MLQKINIFLRNRLRLKSMKQGSQYLKWNTRLSPRCTNKAKA